MKGADMARQFVYVPGEIFVEFLNASNNSIGQGKYIYASSIVI